MNHLAGRTGLRMRLLGRVLRSQASLFAERQIRITAFVSLNHPVVTAQHPGNRVFRRHPIDVRDPVTLRRPDQVPEPTRQTEQELARAGRVSRSLGRKRRQQASIAVILSDRQIGQAQLAEIKSQLLEVQELRVCARALAHRIATEI
jgi:hypothetical protein